MSDMTLLEAATAIVRRDRENYTLSDPEWKGLALVAQCATESIPDLEPDGISDLPQQSLVIQSVCTVLHMTTSTPSSFSYDALRTLLEPLVAVADSWLENNVCDHSVGICYCELGKATELMQHVLWHATEVEHNHCDSCRRPYTDMDAEQCWECAVDERYPQGQEP